MTTSLRRAALPLGLTLVAACIPVYHWKTLEPWDLRQGMEEEQARREQTPVRVRVTSRDDTRLTATLLALHPDGITVRDQFGNEVRLAFLDMKELELRRYDEATSTFVTLLVVLASIPLVLMGVFILLFLAAGGMSCPVVSVPDGEGGWTVVGEVYGGAVVADAERLDLLALPDPGGEVRVRLTRQPSEIEHLDLARLGVVEHGADERAASDPDGRVWVLGASRAPVAATDDGGGDVLAAVASADRRLWAPDVQALIDAPEPPARAGLRARFLPGPADAVVLSVSTSPLQDVATGSLWRAVGVGQEDFQRWGAARARADGVAAWREASGLDLTVEALRGGRWEEVGTVPPVGWLATREVALPLPAGAPVEELRLSGGPGFWQVDRVGLASGHAVEPRWVEARVATLTTTEGATRDVRPAVATSDDVRVDMDPTVAAVDLVFDAPVDAGRARTVFLAAEGHYDMVLDPEAGSDRRLVRHLLDRPEDLGRLALTRAAEVERGLTARAEGLPVGR